MHVDKLAGQRVAVVLGASSGIGRATALSFARRGFDVVLGARSEGALDEVAAQCRRMGVAATAVPTDATDAAAVLALADAAVSAHGHIDVWANIVGIGAIGRFDSTPVEVHRRVIETNLVGGINGAHAVLPHFLQRRRGLLIQMISVGAWTPAPYATAYAASKFGLHGFVQSLRAELSGHPGVQVCAVYPSTVDTPGFAHGANYSGRALVPGGPMLAATDVAEAIADLTTQPCPELLIGLQAWPSRLAHAVAPALTARMLRIAMERTLRQGAPTVASSGNAFAPSTGHAVDGGLVRPMATSGGHVTAGWVGLAGLVGLGLLWLARHRPLR